MYIPNKLPQNYLGGHEMRFKVAQKSLKLFTDFILCYLNVE